MERRIGVGEGLDALFGGFGDVEGVRVCCFDHRDRDRGHPIHAVGGRVAPGRDAADDVDLENAGYRAQLGCDLGSRFVGEVAERTPGVGQRERCDGGLVEVFRRDGELRSAR